MLIYQFRRLFNSFPVPGALEPLRQLVTDCSVLTVPGTMKIPVDPNLCFLNQGRKFSIKDRVAVSDPAGTVIFDGDNGASGLAPERAFLAIGRLAGTRFIGNGYTEADLPTLLDPEAVSPASYVVFVGGFKGASFDFAGKTGKFRFESADVVFQGRWDPVMGFGDFEEVTLGDAALQIVMAVVYNGLRQYALVHEVGV